MGKIKTPWGPLGYVVYKRTYSRRLDDNDPDNTEEFDQTVERVISACRDQLKVGFTAEEEVEVREAILGLKGIVAGRFLWQLGTKTVNKLGLLSLQNCAACVVDHPITPFVWAMDALMLGSGVGFNIQKEYIYELPKVKNKTINIERKDTKDADFIVPDSREGWVELLRRTLEAHFFTGKGFSFSTVCVRGKGTSISGFGGQASGPEELCWGINEISKLLNSRSGKKIRPIDALDIMNIIAYIVVSGNVRRSALIAIGDADDFQYLSAKDWSSGNIPNWRAMSNNSVACNDIKLLPEKFWEGYQGNGEPYGLINLKLSRSCGRLGEKQYKDPDIVCYNPCVSGDTEILTNEGYQRIDSLVDHNVSVWNGFEWSEVIPKITGTNQDMLTVKFSDGRSLTCTKYHKFHIANGYRGETSIVEAKDLELGNKLIKHKLPVIEFTKDLENAYTQGFVSAEGMELNKTLYVYPTKEMCLERIQTKHIVKFEENNNRYRVVLKDRPLSKSFVPFEYSVKSRLDWLAGLFDGDGCELKEGGLQLASVDFEFLKNLQSMLSTLGVQSKVVLASLAGKRMMPDHKGGSQEYFCKESRRICIGATQMQHLKTLGLKCERLSFDKEPQRDASQFVSIIDIVDAGVADTVYCFDEPKNHTGIFNGVITGQCAEQGLNSYETCCLAELFLPNMTSKEELIKVAKYLYRINKHSLTLPCHLEETEKVVHENMRMGIGVTGYLQATEEQRSWLSDTYEELRKFDIKYSKEHGWPTSIKLTTVKPSGTLSLLAGTTSGVHPGFSQYYIRRVRMASNSPLVDLCRSNGYSIEFQKNFDGTDDRNTVIVEFPCSFPEGTVLAKDCTAIQQLEFVKRLQTEWSDNAVSCTVYYKKEELPEIKEWLKKNYNQSVKSVSFLLHSDHGFAQAPLEEISKERYEELMSKVTPIVSGKFGDDGTLEDECAGGVCPIK